MSEEKPRRAADGRPLSLDDPGSESRVAAEQRTCVCGHGRSHHLVSPMPTYTGWGKFWVIFMGVSTQPVRVDFKCRQCGRMFDFTEEPAELRQFL